MASLQEKHYTIGIAGHIDHGKTELTKKLTGVNTDRLKEEKERKISIELGFAPLIENEQMSISIIDVPGHEKFIRQMIAGVHGIDLTLIVIAADEGIMPQTIEHMEILKYLNNNHFIFVITKIDRVEKELLDLVINDVNSYIANTVFENSPIVPVSSVNGEGIDQLKKLINEQLLLIEPKNSLGFFRMPIDDVFHIHGIGTVVRGTVFEGQVSVKDQLKILPLNRMVEVKSIEQFGKKKIQSFAGSRTAMAISNVSVHDIKRGCVLTNQFNATTTQRVDIELNISQHLTNKVKQRSPIKLHTGASEVFGKIILFDRNEFSQDDKMIYAQLELNEPIFVLKNDRFILRRATPIETIGGGRIINPHAEKYRFGLNTIEKLRNMAEMSEEQSIINEISKDEGISLNKISIDQYQLKQLISNQQIILFENRLFTKDFINIYKEKIIQLLTLYHKERPMLKGMNKADLIAKLQLKKEIGKILGEYFIHSRIILQDQIYIHLPNFKPVIPRQIKKQVDDALQILKNNQITVQPIHKYFPKIKQKDFNDILIYLQEHHFIVNLFDDYFIHHDVFKKNMKQLKMKHPIEFSLKDAKEVLNVSRKYLIPFLETLDRMNFTKREEQMRKWIIK